jgi:hypothetical protein
MLSVDAKNAPGPLGAALVSRRSAGRYERALYMAPPWYPAGRIGRQGALSRN